MKKTLAVLATVQLLSTVSHADPERLGYYMDNSSLIALKAESTSLSTVAIDVFALNKKGVLTGTMPAAASKLAAVNHIAVYPVVSNFNVTDFDPAIAKAILKLGVVQDTAVTNIMKLAAKAAVAGINIDIEAVPPGNRAQYTAFIKRVAKALHAKGQRLIISIPAKTMDDPTDSWSGAFDYAALGAIADTLQVMTYDQHGPWGDAGPVAGLDWVTQCANYTLNIVPKSKISLGMSAYGYDWDVTHRKGVTLSWRETPALIAHAHAIPQWDGPSASPYFKYRTTDGSTHVVWYENARSVALKSALAKAKGVASVSVWALGLDNPVYWQAVASGFAGK